MLRLTLVAALAGTAALAQTPKAPQAGGLAPIHDPADLRPEAPLPPDAIVPGAPGVAAIVCEADPPPMDASGALGMPAGTAVPVVPRRLVRIENPWTAAPMMTGAGEAVGVSFFRRGRTLIFDARSEVLYLDRDHRRFTYTRSAPGAVTTWHGICRAEG